jgi:hypothetical protein
VSLRRTAGRLHLPLPHFLWCALCFAGLLAMLASRVLRYTFDSLPGGLDTLLGVALSLEGLLFFALWILIGFFAKVLIVALPVGLLAFRKRLLARYDGRPGTRPFLHSLAWTSLAMSHAAFDLHPLLAGLTWASLPLVLSGPRAFVERLLPHRYLRRGAAAFLVLYVSIKDDLTAATALALWWIALGALVAGRSRLVARDRLGVAVVLVGLTQAAAAWGPNVVPTHGGKRLVDRMAYGFCELEKRHRLYAALTGCPTVPDFVSGREECRQGVVAEFEPSSLELLATHSFFSERFYGRLEQVVCVDDAVAVGLNGVVVDGMEQRDTAIEFDAGNPRAFRRYLGGWSTGHRLAYDAKRDALILVPEWGHGIVRYHRASRRVERVPLRKPHGVARLVGGLDSFELGPESIHQGRDSLFLAEWIGGANVYEVDLDSLEVRAAYPHNDGASAGVTVDEAYGRIYVVGLWGVSAWDVNARRVIWRSRVGLLSRYPVIDEVHGLVYVPSTVAGRIYVFDRETLDARGSIPIGFGVRLAYVSRATGRLFAGSSRGAFSWKTEELARTFLPRTSN